LLDGPQKQLSATKQSASWSPADIDQPAAYRLIRHALEAAGIEFTNEGEPGFKVKVAGEPIPAAD
jgi:hypothetical protein